MNAWNRRMRKKALGCPASMVRWKSLVAIALEPVNNERPKPLDPCFMPQVATVMAIARSADLSPTPEAQRGRWPSEANCRYHFSASS
jgi:hypothetical protein